MQSPSSFQGAKVFGSLDEALDYTRNLDARALVSQTKTAPNQRRRLSDTPRRSSSKKLSNQPHSPTTPPSQKSLVPKYPATPPSRRSLVPKSSTTSSSRRGLVPKSPAGPSSSRRSLVPKSATSPKAPKTAEKKAPGSDRALIQALIKVDQHLQRSKSDGSILPSKDKKILEHEDILFRELATRRVRRKSQQEENNSSPSSSPGRLSTSRRSKSERSYQNRDSNATRPSSTSECDIENQGRQSNPRSTIDNSKCRQRRGALFLTVICLAVVGTTIGVMFEFDILGG